MESIIKGTLFALIEDREVFSETSVHAHPYYRGNIFLWNVSIEYIYQTARRNISEDCYLHSHCHENLKISHKANGSIIQHLLTLRLYSTNNCTSFDTHNRNIATRHVSVHTTILSESRKGFLFKTKQPVRFVTITFYKISLIYCYNKNKYYSIY